jgi:5-methylcytosine-specific restriction endonuclease McrA
LTKFFTGKPCVHGHVDFRFVSNGKCKTCVSLGNAKINASRTGSDFHKKKYERLRDGILKRRKQKRRARGLKKLGPAPRLSKAEKEANKAAYREAHKESRREYDAIRYLEHRSERILSAKEYRAQNPEKIREVKRAVEATRRTRKKGLEGSHTRLDLEEIKKDQRNKCAYCKKKLTKKFHADHILPIALGGSSYRKNIQLLCMICNSSKGAKHPIAWAQRLGLLL